MAANGALPTASLAAVQGALALEGRTAAAMAAMAADAAAAGRHIAIASPDGAYRTLARQIWMFEHPGRYPGKKLARPGTSPHGLGTCVDIVGDLEWAIANAGRFGFTRPIRTDVNHFQHDGVDRDFTPEQSRRFTMELYPVRLNPGVEPAKAQFRAVGPIGVIDATAAEWGAYDTMKRGAWLSIAEDKALTDLAARLAPASTLSDTQLKKIGAAVKTTEPDLSAILAGLKDLPEALVTRLRAFWSTGK